MGTSRNDEEQRAIGFESCSNVNKVTVYSTKGENISFHTIIIVCGKTELLPQKVQ